MVCGSSGWLCVGVGGGGGGGVGGVDVGVGGHVAYCIM